MLDIFWGFLPLNRVLVKRPIWFIRSLHREAGKQENESTTNEKRNRKRGHTGRKEEFSLSPPPCILCCHMDRAERVCVCVCVCVILIPSLYSRSPLLFLLQRLSCSGGCWLQIWPYMVILGSRLSAFHTHFLFPFHWPKHSVCAL